MVTEVMENGMYKVGDGERVLCTITSLGNNIYRAVNMDCDITAEVVPEDDYITRLKCIEHKRRGKDGKYRKTTKLLQSNLKWFMYMLEEKGFIRKAKAR